MRTTRQKSALCWTPRATAARSAGSGSTCWLLKEQLRSRSIGLPNRGTSRRSESWSKKRAAVRPTSTVNERFIPGSSLAQMEKFTTKFWQFCGEANNVANQLSQGIALQFGRFQIADNL